MLQLLVVAYFTDDHNSPGLLFSANLGYESHDFSKPLDAHQKNADQNAVTVLENFTLRNN